MIYTKAFCLFIILSNILTVMHSKDDKSTMGRNVFILNVISAVMMTATLAISVALP